MKILLLDIETSPNLAYVWALFNQDVGLSQLEMPSAMLSFAAKWLGQKGMHFHAEPGGHLDMVQAAHALLDEADVVMHYNGKRFDIPHLNREFLLAGMTPPSPYAQIDLFETVKHRFKFASMKLEHVVQELGIGGKVKHEGFELWRKCMAGEPEAWRTMERYNRQDVKLLEKLYEFLKPWISGHPSLRLYDGVSGCPVCGSTELYKRGAVYTRVSAFPRWSCRKCGSWFRSTKRDRGTDIQTVAV